MTPNVVAALSYVGGAITGIVVLVVEKQNRFVRFHAMQSLVTFVLVLVGNLLLRNVPIIGRFAVVAFTLGVAALWVVLIWKAFQGESYKLPYIGDFAEHQLK